MKEEGEVEVRSDSEKEKEEAREENTGEENTGCLVVSDSPQALSSQTSAAVLPCLVGI